MSESGFTISEIVALFERIDSQILELHKCSSDDFLGLNAKFKGFYKDAKGISTSAGALLLLFSEGANRKLISHLEDFRSDLGRSQHTLRREIAAGLTPLTVIRNELAALFIPLRNAGQNIGTLSLLMANLALSCSSLPSPLRRIQLHDIVDLRIELEGFLLYIQRAVRLAQRFAYRIVATHYEVEGMASQTLKGVDSVSSSVQYGLMLFAEKHAESHARIPEITEKTDRNTKSIASIITNLQYQDIIRQKMEHIQTAHQNLMVGLQESEETSEEGWLQMLVQVRDISTLQSAQLVAANREYQSAIEVISRDFRSIASDMEDIANLCRETLQTEQYSGEATAITRLVERLQKASAILDEISSSEPQMRVRLANVARGTQKMCALIESKQEYFDELCSRILELLPTEEQDSCGLELASQMRQVIDDLHEFRIAINGHTNRMREESLAIEDAMHHLWHDTSGWSALSSSAQQLNEIAIELGHTEKESTSLLQQIEQMSFKVSAETRTAMAEIRYYDMFEGIIGEIVKRLNAISAQIRTEITEEKGADIEALRRLYTMESERKIHNLVIESNEGDVDLFEGGMVGDAEAASDDDDGLELF